MELEAIVNHTLSYSSPLFASQNYHPPNPGNAPTRVALVMRDLSLWRLPGTIIAAKKRFRDPKYFSIGVNPQNHMATTNDHWNESSAGNVMTREKKEEDEKKLPPPPPPEKPEPGDCCGSGCVRCVWDVYYEELEAYNKLYISNSSTDNESKPSSS